MQVSVENVSNLERRVTVSMPSERLESLAGSRLSEIARYPELTDAYCRLLRRDSQPSPEVGHRLEALGLARRSAGEKLAPASLLYARYFDRAL